MKIGAIVQARMGSNRLPNKVLLLADGKPLLMHQIERIRHSKGIHRIIIATTIEKRDDAIVEFCEQSNITYFRGSELDVLDRFYHCAIKFNLKTVVRMTGDDPLQEPEVVDKVIEAFLNNKCDYASNTIKPTYPDGFDVEVFTIEALEKAWRKATLPHDREHVTSYILNNQNEFKCLNVADSVDRSWMNWALDTNKDYLFIKNIIENLNGIRPYFSYRNILDYLISQLK